MERRHSEDLLHRVGGGAAASQRQACHGGGVAEGCFKQDFLCNHAFFSALSSFDCFLSWDLACAGGDSCLRPGGAPRPSLWFGTAGCVTLRHPNRGLQDVYTGLNRRLMSGQHSCANLCGAETFVVGKQANATHILAGEASWRIKHFRTKGGFASQWAPAARPPRSRLRRQLPNSAAERGQDRGTRATASRYLTGVK